MTIPSITPEPIGPPADPPTRDDPDNFRTRADDFVDWQANDFPTEIDGFITEMNTTISAMNATAVDVDADAAIALSAKEYVYAVYNAALWLSGTTYDQGDGAIGSNGYTYISLQGSNINHDPTTDDGTWWKRTNGPWPYNAESQSSSSDITLVATDPRMQQITMTAALKTVTLPDAQNLEVGPMFWLFNEGDYDYIVTDYGGNALFVVEPGKEYPITCFLINNATQNGTWKFSEATTRAISETPVVFATSGVVHTAPVNLDDSTMIVAYQHYLNDNGYIVAIDISDGSILDGPYLIEASVTARYFVGEKISSTEAAFAYFDDTNNQLDVIVARYTSSTLSMPGGPTTAISNLNGQSFGLCVLSSTEIAVAGNDTSNNDLRAAILGWNGSTLSVSGSATQISSSDHDYMTCAKIDSSNFLICAELSSSNDMYAYSVNWNGSDTISENNNVQLGTHTVGSQPALIQLEDDGTYIWYACVFADADYRSRATIEIVRATKLDTNVAASITETLATENVYDNYHTNSLACIDEEILLIPYAKDPYNNTNVRPFLVMYEWNSTGPTLTKYPSEYELSNIVESGYISSILTTTNDLIVTCRDTDNSFYGTTIKSRIVI